ncbi:MAG TPA: tRNA uridine-5-carboxymethylaminomethyl(34) synthesis GTPase MnmE [Thermodesulfobacteriota bacterium]|nr:tRNA uridine-5-carboxymethylaminomethyl(34) synthesis GTPase MnmE [Thermodesulfobacteriota bacterium]
MVRISLPHQDTIAAIATPPGEGGIAIIRISGPRTLELLNKIFKRVNNKSVFEMSSHRLYRGRVIDPASERVYDNVLSVFMKSPRSYTGEDVAEIHTHGGHLVPKKVLELLFRYGARPASPGEFTLRAFLNGRMDLAQAEAVSDVVNAQTEESLKQAELQMEGVLSRRIWGFRDTVLDILAEVEAQVDFPEEDIDPIIKTTMIERTTDLIAQMDNLLASYEEGRILKYGVYTAILGKPNVGKSSLLNRLLMKERAIVSPHPGTTRDFIEETLDVRGIPLRLVDTAGLRATADEVEKVGVELAKKKGSEAELVIAVVDGSLGLDGDDLEVIKCLDLKKSILIINKTDLPPQISEEDVSKFYPRELIVKTSAKSGLGIEELKTKIHEVILGKNNRSESAEIVLTEQRHKVAIQKARVSLLSFLKALDRSESPEFLAIDLRSALDSLGEITGETTTEDVLGRIFSKFCIGK